MTAQTHPADHDEDETETGCRSGGCYEREECGCYDTDEDCMQCYGTGERIPDHCCDCGGGVYNCVCCSTCGAGAGTCGCPIPVTTGDGEVKTL